MSERARIMIVDDDFAMLEMAELVMSEFFDVVLAASGKQALELLERGSEPELILMDVGMPEMDGFEALSQIQKMPKFESVPVIFLTGITGNDAELTGLVLGAQDYITKPFVWENLFARVRLRLESGREKKQILEMSNRMSEMNLDEAKLEVLTADFTEVQRKVVRLLALGYDNNEVAKILNYSYGYVKNIVSIIHEKLGVKSRRELRILLRK